MKVHRNVTVLEVDDPVLLTELQTVTSLDEAVVRAVSDTLVVVDAAALEPLIEDLVARGYAPRVRKP